MTTMAQAIRECILGNSAGVTSTEVKEYINSKYANQWKPGTLTAHLYGCRVNQRTAYLHHPSAEKFLFKTDDGRFHLYDEALHGPNVWQPTDIDADIEEGEEGIEQRIETSITFERDVEEHLIQNLGAIEKGLRFVSRQERIEVGRVDILAEDISGRRVVIELKVGEAKDSAIGQIARYLGWYARADQAPPRGMIIASDFPEPIRYAAEAIKDLTLVTYRVQFAFAQVNIES